MSWKGWFLATWVIRVNVTKMTSLLIGGVLCTLVLPDPFVAGSLVHWASFYFTIKI